MNVLFIILPLSFVIAAGIIVAFIVATKNGQWDDLDTPAYKVLTDDIDTHDGESK